MKKKMGNKIVALLLSAAMAVGIGGAGKPIYAADRANGKNTGRQAVILAESEQGGLANRTAPAPDGDGSQTDRTALVTENAGLDHDRTGETDAVVFTVTMDGVTTAYENEEDIAEAWKSVQGKTAEIHLMKDIDVSKVTINENVDLLHTLYLKSGNITLTMKEKVKLFNPGSDQVVDILGGTFILESGEISSSNNLGIALTVQGGSVYIKEGAILSGNIGISVWNENEYGKPKVKISGGVFTGKERAVECDAGLTLKDILENGYAFKDVGNSVDEKWVQQDLSITNNLGQGTFRAEQHPMKFTQHPESLTTIYGSDLPPLHAEAGITDPSAFNDPPAAITYEWYQTAGDESTDTGTAGQDYAFQNLMPAGTYQYYCRASCEWFALNSNTAVVEVSPKTLTAQIAGTALKEYDATTDVLPGQLSIQLDGIVNGDEVTAAAANWSYDSAQAGDRKITASGITLQGKDAGNYKLSSDSLTIDGKILPPAEEPVIPVAGVSLDESALEMEAGSTRKLQALIQPHNATNQKVAWSSGNPAIASVDASGIITAVSAGSTVITAVTEDGNYTASCQVAVRALPDGTGGGSGSAGGTGGGIIMGGGGEWMKFPQPFLKGRPDRNGWSEIRSEVEKAAAASKSSTVCIDMNGTVSVPGNVISAVRDRDVTLSFDMGGGFLWNVSGKEIESDIFSETDFSVKMNTEAIPKELADQAAGGFPRMELELAQKKVFGFTAELTFQIAGMEENRISIGSGLSQSGCGGMYANLYSYNPALRSLEFVCSKQIAQDGTVHLPFHGASAALVILSEQPMDGGPQDGEKPETPSQPQEPEETAKAQVKSVKLSKTVYTYNGKVKKPAVIAMDTLGKRITGSNYHITYKNNKYVGKAAAVVSFHGKYSGTMTKSFTIRPAGTLIQKAAAAAGGFTVTWARQAVQTSGYQMQYSENAEFTGSSTHSVFVKKPSQTKTSVKKSKSAGNGYVRIRTYQTVKEDGQSRRIYSAWSPAVRIR
ncbi:MAG: Ig domain-containing protein [Eubacterium sp.]|nr:Ig domain-containing protein [Eubacterium sp.]